jgi:hypothetical protein
MNNDGGASFSLQRRLQPANAWRILASSSAKIGIIHRFLRSRLEIGDT